MNIDASMVENGKVGTVVKNLIGAITSASRRDQITGAMILIGFITTILSSFDICSAACTDASLYTLFGLPFVWTGLTFYFLIGGLFVLHRKANTDLMIDFLAYSAVGAEAFFIIVQKYAIGHWCPLCLVIATSVFILAITRLVVRLRSGLSKRQASTHSAIAVLLVMIGFVISLVALEPPKDIAEAQAVVSAQGIMTLSDEDIWFGKTDSNIEVYFVFDWYCPFCRATEKDVEAVIPDIGKIAKYTFLDLTAHKQSKVLSPYGIDLLLGDKDGYIAGRRALLALSEDKKVPTEDEIVSSLKSLNINYRPVDTDRAKVLDSMSAVFFLQNNVNATPSVVVINKSNNKRQVFATDKIRYSDIHAAITAVQ